VIRTHVPWVVAVLLCGVAACRSTPDPAALENQNKNLHEALVNQQAKLDQLSADRVALDRRVKELEAKLAKMQSTEQVVEQAKEEISEHVRQVLARFEGDDKIEVVRTPTGYRFVVREAVLFGSASTTLTDEGKRTLGRIAETLREGNERISIEGHTDDVPVKKPESLKLYPRGNIELSVARAFAVYDYLVKDANVPASRVAVVGYGPYRPAVPNTSEANRWLNRRVEILVEER